MSEGPALSGTTVVLGVTGSIAAYKAADLCSKLVQAGASVFPVLTRGAERFIGRETFWALSGNPVTRDTFEEPFSTEQDVSPIAHLRYAQVADIFLVAPASADFLARLAAGFADDMLTASLLANVMKPVLLAPAMNTGMWENPATQANCATLANRGYRFINPVVGRLAEGTVGTGRMAEPLDILAEIATLRRRKKNLSGLNVLVTAGPTRESIDPVRFLSNRSSGKMGYAIAEAARDRGARVTLITGPTSIPVPTGVTAVRVISAAEMANACFEHSNTANVIIAAAAVADFTPNEVAKAKIKKSGDALTVTLVPTLDILRRLGATKHTGQLLIGFAAETNDLLENAVAKLRSKNLDLIVANDITQEGAGFDSDTNIVTLLQPEKPPIALPMMSKAAVGDRLCDWIVEQRQH
jgi:phosphopantothenoylcysteine decarboxylase/phosphopantothenate--cysteine ligase